MKYILIFAIFFSVLSCSKPSKESNRGPLKFEVADKVTFPLEVKAGEEFSFSIKVTNVETMINTFGTAESDLPETVSFDFNDETVKVAGTVAKAGTYKFTLDVTCKGTQVSGQTGKKEFSIVVK